MRNGQTGAAEAAPQITPPAIPPELSGERYLLETATCRVWCLATGTLVRREWARGERLMAVNERGLTPSALERHKRAWKKLAESLAARGCTLADL